MYYTVYKTTNWFNGMVYIGCHKTDNLDDGYLGSGSRIKKAVEKFGDWCFIKEYIKVFDNFEEANLLEAKLVDDLFVENPQTYNVKNGGRGGFDFINNHEDIGEWRKIAGESSLNRGNLSRARAVLKEKCETDEEFYSQMVIHLNKIRLKRDFLYPDGVWKGRKHKEETKKKIGAANSILSQGEGNSQYGTIWITDGLENKKIKSTDDIPEQWRRGRTVKKTKGSDN